MRRWWICVGLMLLLLQGTPVLRGVQGPLLAAEPVLAQRAYLDGVLAMSAQDYRDAVRSFERVVQLAPTNMVYERMLRLARQKLQDPSLLLPQKGLN